MIRVGQYLVGFLDQPELKSFKWITVITEHTHTLLMSFRHRPPNQQIKERVKDFT